MAKRTQPAATTCAQCGSTKAEKAGAPVDHVIDDRTYIWQRMKCECGQMRMDKSAGPIVSKRPN